MKERINMAYYRQTDWDRFLQLIDDRKSMHDSWEEWHKAYEKAKKSIEAEGLVVNQVIVDIDELDKYCKVRGIKNDGKARSKYIIGK